jgi:hypothetical protein
MTDKSLFIEEIIINSLKFLLAGRVNDLLGEMEYPIPPVEFGSYRGGSFVVPVIALSTCERSEKERIIRLDAYSLTITFAVPEWPGGERNCYAYAASVAAALRSRANRVSFLTRIAADKPAAHFRYTGAFIGAPTVPHRLSTLLDAVRFLAPPVPPLLVVREYTGDKYKRFVLW